MISGLLCYLPAYLIGQIAGFFYGAFRDGWRDGVAAAMLKNLRLGGVTTEFVQKTPNRPNLGLQ